MATLKVKIQEDIVLDNQDYGSKRTLEISSIDEIYKRIVTCPASYVTVVASFNSNVYGAAGALDVEDVKYIRITNKDDTNALELGVIGAATNYMVELGAGESHVLGSPDTLMLAEADTDPSFGTMTDLSSIEVDPGSNAIDVELFIASG